MSTTGLQGQSSQNPPCKPLICCCCGGDAPTREQWWNRDTGYGLCGTCARMIQARPDYDADDFRRNYGDEGIHWMKGV